jgi:glutamyl-tRNA synthetase
MKRDALPLLEAAREALAGANGFDAASVEAALAPLPERLDVKPGKLYQPIRVAISGGSVSPGIFESLAALGREQAIARIDVALARLRE